MRKTITLVLFTLFSLGYGQTIRESYDTHPAIDTYPEWRLAMQLWTFHKYTFLEALDKTASLGLSWVEAFPGQKLRKEQPESTFDHDMSDEDKVLVRKWLKERGLRLVNYGVVGLPDDEAACRKVFEFAREMGIETIASEPPDEAWDLIERLCDEYGINVAVHNHPDPSPYWHPDKVVKVAEGRSDRIGACADIGHWMRSGVRPADALRTLQKKVISFHFGDLNTFGDKEAHDVPWGTGVADLKALMNQIRGMGFKGVFSIEYEYNWTASIPEIRKSIAFFEEQVRTLFPATWKPLLAADLSNCILKPKTWKYKDGVLEARGKGDIWTKERYGNFVLDLEFKLEKKTNSGVFLRTGDVVNWLHTAIEVQVLDSYGKTPPDKHDCGAIYDCLEPALNAVKPAGEWNRCTITCVDEKINVVLNGETIIEMDLNLWTEAHLNPDGTKNKFNTAYKDMPREGHIGFQYHGHPVWYRNIRIKEL